MGELVHLRLEKNLRKQIKGIVNTGLFSNMTEFVRDSIRKNIEDYHRKLVLMKIKDLQYSAKALTEKEKREKRNELETISSSDLFRKFGFNE
ncbi:hypothetical protein HQ529_05220 [Candidatus Woesearchaeota archaeon]|nr:hypothetical protein [Candidatus Woesearchaeota archaeon]